MKNKKAKINQPLDWIRCPEGITKAVVACMANCDKKCSNFWEFFAEIGKSPSEYYNYNQLGDKCMRRIVFDCDRCGKKDISPVFSLYDEKTYPENKLLTEKEKSEMMQKSDFIFDEVGLSFFEVLLLLEQEKDWRHYCDKCFNKILGSWAMIMKVKRRGGDVKSDAILVETPKKAKKTSSKKTKAKKLVRKSAA